MTGPAKRKGDKAELEVQGLLRDHLGVPARRQLGAGRKDDIGDVTGVPNTTIQVASYADIGRAIREKLPKTVAQQARAGSLFGALFCRRRGGEFVVVLTVDQYATLWREAQPIPQTQFRKPFPSFTADPEPCDCDRWGVVHVRGPGCQAQNEATA